MKYGGHRMSFFKEFKEDLSTAMNELLPGSEEQIELEDELAEEGNKEIKDLGVESELEKLDGILQSYSEVEKKPSFIVPELKKPSFISNVVATDSREKVNETSIITTGMILTGNLQTTSSVEVRGVINGDVQCAGNSHSAVIGNRYCSTFLFELNRSDFECSIISNIHFCPIQCNGIWNR